MAKKTITPPRAASKFGSSPAALSEQPVPALNAKMVTFVVDEGRDKETLTVLEADLKPRSKVVAELCSAGEHSIRLPNTESHIFKLYVPSINTGRIFTKHVGPGTEDSLLLLRKLFVLAVQLKDESAQSTVLEVIDTTAMSPLKVFFTAGDVHKIYSCTTAESLARDLVVDMYLKKAKKHIDVCAEKFLKQFLVDLAAKKAQLLAAKGMKQVVVVTAPAKIKSEDGEFLPADMSEHQAFFLG